VTANGEATIGGTIAIEQSAWQGGGPSAFATAATETVTAIAAASVARIETLLNIVTPLVYFVAQGARIAQSSG
jgi:hypothetical protein